MKFNKIILRVILIVLTTFFVSCGGGGGGKGGGERGAADIPIGDVPVTDLVLAEISEVSIGEDISVSIPSAASVTLTAGTIENGQRILLSQVEKDVLIEEFNLQSIGMQELQSANYQLILSVGSNLPKQPISMSLVIPNDFNIATVSQNNLRIFYFNSTSGDNDEQISSMESLDVVLASPTEATVSIPPEAFEIGSDGSTFEVALIIAAGQNENVVATTNGYKAASFSMVTRAASVDKCGGDLLAPPLEGSLVAGSKFGLRNLTAGGTTTKGHSGLDLTIGIGNPVYSMTDGVVAAVASEHCTAAKVKAKNQKCYDPIQKQPRCTTKKECDNFLVGWGHFIVITNNVLGLESGLNRYAHLKLKSESVKAGDVVQAGTLIGLSGNTGRTTGPHLHIENVPRGGQKPIDPYQCLLPAMRLVKDAQNSPIATYDNGPTPHECCSFFMLRLPFESNVDALQEFSNSLQYTDWTTTYSFSPSGLNPNAYINWYGTTYRESSLKTNSSIMRWGASVHHGGQYDIAQKKDSVHISFQFSVDAENPFNGSPSRITSNSVSLDINL